MDEIHHLDSPRGVRLAYARHAPESLAEGRTGFVWLGGFRSDMTGTKALALHEFAQREDRPYVRFDYTGHGLSGGRFEEATLSDWVDDAESVLRQLARWPAILVGSSMGGHIALLLYRRLEPAARARIAGLLLIAPAADFTEDLIWAGLSEEARAAIRDKGVWPRPSAYGEPYPITRALIEDGRRHRYLDQGVDLDCPVHILQGDADPDVPWQHALKLYRALRGEDIRFTLIKDGDHRLSTPRDIETILEAAGDLALRAERGGSR